MKVIGVHFDLDERFVVLGQCAEVFGAGVHDVLLFFILDAPNDALQSVHKSLAVNPCKV